jgi:hypothetical protein
MKQQHIKKCAVPFKALFGQALHNSLKALYWQSNSTVTTNKPYFNNIWMALQLLIKGTDITSTTIKLKNIKFFTTLQHS